MRNVMNFTSQHKCKRIVHPGEQNIGSFEVTESVRKRALRSTPKSQHSMTELKLNTNVCKCRGGMTRVRELASRAPVRTTSSRATHLPQR